MDALFKLCGKIFGTRNDRLLKHYNARVSEINALEPEISSLTDQQLQEKTPEFKARLEKGESLNHILPEAFAVVREASKRVLNMRHFDVQLIGGMVLHDGRIAEMRTGEGKTLVSTLPVYLNALTGKGVHVVTVNDYLAKRDSQWMGKIHQFLGLTVGCIECEPASPEKIAAYQCDIVYGTNNEFGFDYLRDNLAMDKTEFVQKNHNFAVIDEIDSILIDEARTPLIISGPSDDKTELYTKLDALIPQLKPEHYDLDEENKAISLTDDGYDFAEDLLRETEILPKGESLYDGYNALITHHLSQAMKAHKLFIKDKDYIIKNDSVMLIDEFTGRIMDGRRFSDGLHQAIEAKENVTIQPENQTLSSVTFQNYFRFYKTLSGMTGTAQTEADEFKESFGLEIVVVPTNKQIQRLDKEDALFVNVDKKYKAIVTEIKEAQKRKQPVLVGTASIERSEELSEFLKKENVKHQILNARYHEQEANIVAQAGRLGSVTISTNMAGRGTDIQLGGSLEVRIQQEIPQDISDHKRAEHTQKIQKEVETEKQQVIQAGGLLVIGTERHDSRRIDNQLRGRSGRQGDPGQSRFYLSFDDDLLRVFGGDKLKAIFQKIGLEDEEALENKMLSNTIERTQKKVEQRNYDARRNLMKFDNIMNDQRSVIFKARRDLLEKENYQDTIVEMITNYVTQILPNYCNSKASSDEWEIETLLEYLTDNLGHHDYGIVQFCAQDGVDFTIFKKYLTEKLISIYQEKISPWPSEVSTTVHSEVVLRPLDFYWREHLNLIGHISKVINFRGYGQKDPLIEFKKEAYESFNNFLSQKRQDTLQRIFRVELDLSDLESNQETHNIDDTDTKIINQETGQKMSLIDYPRNALCPCDSGKKFKHCHGSPNVLAKAMV